MCMKTRESKLYNLYFKSWHCYYISLTYDCIFFTIKWWHWNGLQMYDIIIYHNNKTICHRKLPENIKLLLINALRCYCCHSLSFCTVKLQIFLEMLFPHVSHPLLYITFKNDTFVSVEIFYIRICLWFILQKTFIA